MQSFLKDYEQSKKEGRYLNQELPELKFKDRLCNRNHKIFKANGAHLLLQTNITETLNIIEHFIEEILCK